MSEAKSCDHCGAGPDEPCPVGCTCGRDGDVSEAKHCQNRYLCKLHDCACPCDGCLPHSDPEAHENKTLRADVARLTRDRDAARAALLSVYSHCWSHVSEPPTVEEQATAIKRYIGFAHADAEEHRIDANQHRADRDAALRWSRLWHHEARRLWREVQDLGNALQWSQEWEDGVVGAARAACETLRAALDPDAPEREVEPEQWMRDVGGEPTRATVFTHLPGGGVCRCLHDDGPVCADCPRAGGEK